MSPQAAVAADDCIESRPRVMLFSQWQVVITATDQCQSWHMMTRSLPVGLANVMWSIAKAGHNPPHDFLVAAAEVIAEQLEDQAVRCRGLPMDSFVISAERSQCRFKARSEASMLEKHVPFCTWICSGTSYCEQFCATSASVKLILPAKTQQLTVVCNVLCSWRWTVQGLSNVFWAFCICKYLPPYLESQLAIALESRVALTTSQVCSVVVLLCRRPATALMLCGILHNGSLTI